MKYVNLALLAVLLPFAPSFAAEHPCNEIVQACKAAGFTKGGHKTNKGLYKDCVNPVKSGQTIAGVDLKPGVVQACNTKKHKTQPTTPAAPSTPKTTNS